MSDGKQAVLERIRVAVSQTECSEDKAQQQIFQPYQLAEYRAARNWLKRYRPPGEATPLEQVKGYLEAFFTCATWQILKVRIGW